MKYFIDQEFIEGFHEPSFGKRRHFIDLISIGIVCEDGREYYAISREYSYEDASSWVKENVVLPIFKAIDPDDRKFCRVHNFHKHFGKSNEQIAREIFAFVNPYATYFETKEGLIVLPPFFQSGGSGLSPSELSPFSPSLDVESPEFYGYYADYDWVLFCSLFGTMMDLPKGFPMYCKDLKQMLDECAAKLGAKNIDAALDLVKSNLLYPKQENEHNALADARWNKVLYEFLMRPQY